MNRREEGTFGSATRRSIRKASPTELLNTRRWRTRTELSTEIFDWIEVFYNRTRRHSSLGMLAPIAYEKLHADDTSAA